MRRHEGSEARARGREGAKAADVARAQHEQPELELQKSTLLAAEDKLKIELESMEQKLLEDLAASEGNLLENKTLIDSLNTLKAGAVKIKEKLQQSAVDDMMLMDIDEKLAAS